MFNIIFDTKHKLPRHGFDYIIRNSLFFNLFISTMFNICIIGRDPVMSLVVGASLLVWSPSALSLSFYPLPHNTQRTQPGYCNYNLGGVQ